MSSTAPPASPGPRKAAVLGSPIAHSKSPQLHLAAYHALGLDDWTYERIECGAEELPGVVGGFGPEWVGVSVTAPGKFAALDFADERTERAQQVGSANTLVRTPRGWRADNTDIDGVSGAIGSASGWALVCGSGGTAPAAVVGLAQLGVSGITVVARNPDKAARLVDLGASAGVPTRFCELDDPDARGLAAEVAAAEVLVSTIPAEVAARYARTFAMIPVLLDAVYDPWPTPLAAAVAAAGGRAINGVQMLLHQAFAQVEQFTGLPAPRDAMTCALAALD
ncbi:shikimate dehydrogenase [Mycobacterium florentinum]|uniref:Shikimate dehydrogenase n=1 Tax=Mycobacterium florentinum TaxID=292462 RepID=A0A1X1U997_MYCFL|nr:shikimate dehydrogenase [Mycobacterium florentinum]MCV7408669.1 shikimate dehydrogenase [Mycobacterium florentinum]ORV53376.1 shikimate dehydrogenase [Mycobacterium florentinum]BBX77461.1 shikimate dehydrogenase [Mycobacterium florentinum]